MSGNRRFTDEALTAMVDHFGYRTIHRIAEVQSETTGDSHGLNPYWSHLNKRGRNQMPRARKIPVALCPRCAKQVLRVTIRKFVRDGQQLSGCLKCRERTHCRNNHPLGGENLYVHTDGYVRCRICRNAGRRRRYALVRPRGEK